MTDDINLETANAHSALPLGETLSAARTSKKLSQQDVSNHLRFSVKQVDALENNQFDALPDAMITRGFIRNYARYLELDAEPLLESYKARVPNKSPSAMSVQSAMYQVMPGKESQPWLKYILGSILVLLFLLAWIFYMDYMPKNSQPVNDKVPEAVAPNAPTEVPLPEIALPAAEREAASENIPASLNADPAVVMPEAVTPGATTEGAATPGAEVSNAPTPKPSASNAAANLLLPLADQRPTGTAIAPVASVSALPVKTITLSVTEKTWINVTDKTGKVLYERILPPGSVDAIDAEPPLNVVVGNAKATTLAYQGQPINLASSMTENNVARIKLE